METFCNVYSLGGDALTMVIFSHRILSACWITAIDCIKVESNRCDILISHRVNENLMQLVLSSYYPLIEVRLKIAASYLDPLRAC